MAVLIALRKRRDKLARGATKLNVCDMVNPAPRLSLKGSYYLERGNSGELEREVQKAVTTIYEMIGTRTRDERQLCYALDLLTLTCSTTFHSSCK